MERCKTLGHSRMANLEDYTLMPLYKNYGTKKETPSRKTRKGLRNTAFMNNKLAARKSREARAILRREQAETEPS